MIAKKKIARDLKKKKINGQSADASIEEVPLSDCSVATKIDSTSTTSASTNLKIMRGMDDPSVMSALMDPELVIESLVPKCFLEGLKLYLGGNAMHLLADMDFETPDCIRDVNKSILSCISSSSSSTVTTPTTLSSSSSSTLQLVSTDALEMWVASAQITLVVAVMKALLGGCGRLQRALSSLGQRTPENLRVWNSTPESLYKRLLEYDPGLSSIYLSRLREGVCLREMFSLDWVRWMCTVCEDMRSSQSMLWLIHYTVDADEEESNEGDENGEEEVVVDDNENLWLSVPDDSNHIGSTVRCYPLSDDYWDEGEVIGYLPPDEEEPLPLWKVTGIRRSMITSSASGSNVKSSKSTNDSKIWTLDLEKEELIDALALYSALT